MEIWMEMFLASPISALQQPRENWKLFIPNTFASCKIEPCHPKFDNSSLYNEKKVVNFTRFLWSSMTIRILFFWATSWENCTKFFHLSDSSVKTKLITWEQEGFFKVAVRLKRSFECWLIAIDKKLTFLLQTFAPTIIHFLSCVRNLSSFIQEAKREEATQYNKQIFSKGQRAKKIGKRKKSHVHF